MPMKIDDILNPKPEPNIRKDRLLGVLRKSKEDGLALTKTELFNADRFNWLDVAPVGEGGLLLTFLASAVDLELGVSKKLDELREQALRELIKAGRVIERESDSQTYYWIADTDKMFVSS